MHRLILIVKILFIIMLLTGLFFVVKYADMIRSTLANRSTKQVAGANTSLEKELKKDLENYFDTAKKSVLDIKVSDVVSNASRFKKIGSDINGIKDYLFEEIEKKTK